MKKRKRAALVALAVSMTAMLAMPLSSCSIGSTSSKGGVTTINFWHVWQGDEAKDMQKTVDEFNASQSAIVVNVLASTNKTKQLTALSGGEPPDVADTLDYNVSNWAQMGALAPLDSYIAASKMDSSDVPASVWSEGAYNGKQYGIPYTMDTYMLFYNKDMLAAAGITAPPKTTSEWYADSVKLTKTDKNGAYTQLGWDPENPWTDPINLQLAFGGNFYDTANDKVTADDAGILAALNFKDSFYTAPFDAKKIVTFRSGYGEYQSASNPMFTNKIAFDVEGEWYPTFIKQYAANASSIAECSIPYPDGHPELANGGQLQSGMLYIPKASKNKAAAWTFVNWMLGTKQYNEFCASKGSLPTTYTALKDPTLVANSTGLQPFIDLVNEKNVRAFPSLPFSSQYVNEFSTDEEAMYQATGALTPQQVIDKVNAAIQPLADKWKASK